MIFLWHEQQHWVFAMFDTPMISATTSFIVDRTSTVGSCSGKGSAGSMMHHVSFFGVLSQVPLIFSNLYSDSIEKIC